MDIAIKGGGISGYIDEMRRGSLVDSVILEEYILAGNCDTVMTGRGAGGVSGGDVGERG